MRKIRRTLFAAGLFLLLSATAHPLRAQTSISPDGSTTIITTTTPVLYAGSYTGTVTQTTAAGQVTTGTFTLNPPSAFLTEPNAARRIDSGRITATITLNGVTTNYTGRLARNDRGYRSLPGIAYLRAVVDDTQPLASSVKIPVIVNVDQAYGGIQDETGNSLTFRGARAVLAVTVGGE